MDLPVNAGYPPPLLPGGKESGSATCDAGRISVGGGFDVTILAGGVLVAGGGWFAASRTANDDLGGWQAKGWFLPYHSANVPEVDITKVQELLGHRHTITTQIYHKRR